MDYCTAMNFLKNKSDYRSVFETLFYPIEIDRYMEQNKIFEIIGELMIRAAIDRPCDIVDYLIEKLLEIANKFRRNVVTIEFDNCIEDASRMLERISRQSKIPIIECVNEDSRRFLMSSLRNHHFIICDFKSTPGDEDGEKMMKIKLEENGQLRRAKLCYEKLAEIVQGVRTMKPKKVFPSSWTRRILIVGRIGSGRKTQARLIAKEFGLIFIDFDYLIAESLAHDNMSFMGFAQKKLLKPDCLQNGYICVANVISKDNLQILMEKFIYQPNQIIFLHTKQKVCRKRIERREKIFTSYQASIGHKDMKEFLNYQMNLYEIHKREFVEYFQGERRRMIIHVDGNKKIEDVKNLIFARLSQQ